MLVLQTLGVRNSKSEWNFKVNGKRSGVAKSDDSIGRATKVLNIWRELVIDLACEKIATLSTTVKENWVQSNVIVTVSRIKYGARLHKGLAKLTGFVAEASRVSKAPEIAWSGSNTVVWSVKAGWSSILERERPAITYLGYGLLRLDGRCVGESPYLRSGKVRAGVIYFGSSVGVVHGGSRAWRSSSRLDKSVNDWMHLSRPLAEWSKEHPVSLFEHSPKTKWLLQYPRKTAEIEL